MMMRCQCLPCPHLKISALGKMCVKFSITEAIPVVNTNSNVSTVPAAPAEQIVNRINHLLDLLDKVPCANKTFSEGSRKPPHKSSAEKPPPMTKTKNSTNRKRANVDLSIKKLCNQIWN